MHWKCGSWKVRAVGCFRNKPELRHSFSRNNHHMKRHLFLSFLLILAGAFSGSIAQAQCTLNITASDSDLCLGDSAILSANGPAVSGALSTTLAGGNNHRGNMFNIVALNTITINSFDAHPMGNTDYAIYYKVGSHVGFEMNSAAWTLVGTATGVVAQPFGTATPLPKPSTSPFLQVRPMHFT